MAKRSDFNERKWQEFEMVVTVKRFGWFQLNAILMIDKEGDEEKMSADRQQQHPAWCNFEAPIEAGMDNLRQMLIWSENKKSCDLKSNLQSQNPISALSCCDKRFFARTWLFGNAFLVFSLGFLARKRRKSVVKWANKLHSNVFSPDTFSWLVSFWAKTAPNCPWKSGF